MKRNCDERDKFLARNEAPDKPEKFLETMVRLAKSSFVGVYQFNLRVNLFYKTVDENHFLKIKTIFRNFVLAFLDQCAVAVSFYQERLGTLVCSRPSRPRKCESFRQVRRKNFGS